MISLLGHPSLMDDLKTISPSASEQQIKHALMNKRYRLEYWTDDLGQQHYGIVKMPGGVAKAGMQTENHPWRWNTPLLTPMKVEEAETTDPVSQKQRTRSVFQKVAPDILLLCLILALFAVVLAYRIVGDAATPFNNFMNSDASHFGPRFLLTAGAAIISLRTKKMEQHIRMIEPYRLMASSPQSAKDPILLPTQTTSISSFVMALKRKDYFVATVAFTAGVLSEVLIIVIAGVPFSNAQLWGTYIASTYASLVILAVMALVVIVILVRRCQELDLPRDLDSLINVWLYICG